MTESEKAELWSKVNQNTQDIAVLKEKQTIENKHMVDAIETLGRGFEDLSKAVYKMMGMGLVINVFIVPVLIGIVLYALGVGK